MNYGSVIDFLFVKIKYGNDDEKKCVDLLLDAIDINTGMAAVAKDAAGKIMNTQYRVNGKRNIDRTLHMNDNREMMDQNQSLIDDAIQNFRLDHICTRVAEIPQVKAAIDEVRAMIQSIQSGRPVRHIPAQPSPKEAIPGYRKGIGNF